ncbi:hypothetical protein GALL_504530 [mine drainage metagenome]|uniref:Uncharacterized protein n=1 Tax=mine drainage metagenome TaxID=410659 RepID=A0A1J5PJJ2_9ZZZZ
MTLPRTGQRKVGKAPVASAALTGFSAETSSTVVACAKRAFCWGSAVTAATLVAGGTDVATGCAAAVRAGWATGAAAAVLAGTVSFMPSWSFAVGSMPLARASSVTET